MTDLGGETAPVGGPPATPVGGPPVTPGGPPSAPVGTDATATPAAGSSGPGLSMGATAEWPVKAVDAIDLVVATVNDKAIRPAVVAARGIVFGLLIAVVGVLIVVLGSVGVLRLLDVYVFPGRIWASYAVLGLLFSAVGLVAWTRRRVPESSGPS